MVGGKLFHGSAKSKHESTLKMIKILYYIYVGICSFHPILPFIKANDVIAIAPLPADLIRPFAIRTFENWLDDVYLNSREQARNNPSRFTESEDYLPLPDPIVRPQHSASGSVQNGIVQRPAPRHVLIKSRTPLAMNGSRANRCGTTTFILRPTIAIVIQFLFACPPPHDPRFIVPPFKYLIVASRHKKILQIFGDPSSTTLRHIEPNSIWIVIFPPRKTYTTPSTLLILTPSATKHTPSPTLPPTHTPSTLPPNSIHRYPTMPSKISKQPPRKPPPEQIVPMVPLAIYPPPGHHPSDSAILGSHRGNTSLKSTVNVRTNSLVSRSNTTTPQQPCG